MPKDIQRSEALCDGKIIGIDSIYTVVDGKQINKKGEVERLRELGRQGKLLCPCGCGAKLYLVAGENNLRTQHFRIQGHWEGNCSIKTESKEITTARTLIRCWLDDNFPSSKIDSGVSLNTVDDSKRRYEFSFLNQEYKIAVGYWRDTVNITEEKLSILKDNQAGITYLLICDSKNALFSSQYPEERIKLQNAQGFCLYLDTSERLYDTAHMIATIFLEDFRGSWTEEKIADGLMSQFKIAEGGMLSFAGTPLPELVERRTAFFNEQNEFRRKKYEEAKQRNIQEAIERKKKRETAFSSVEELLNLHIHEKKGHSSSITTPPPHVSKSDVESEEEKRSSGAADVKHKLDEGQQKSIDRYGVRWARCKFCGQDKPFPDFDKDSVDYKSKGYCKECIDRIAKSTEQTLACPRCGSPMTKKNGAYGEFLACSNYPKCTGATISMKDFEKYHKED